MWPSETELKRIMGVLEAEFGEDLMQTVMVILGEAVEAGFHPGEGKEWFPWCYGVARRQQFKAWYKEARRAEVLIDPWKSSKITDGLCSTRDIDPSSLAEWREILDTLPVDFVLDTPLSRGGEEDELPMGAKEATRRYRIRKEVRQEFGL